MRILTPNPKTGAGRQAAGDARSGETTGYEAQGVRQGARFVCRAAAPAAPPPGCLKPGEATGDEAKGIL
jgi:hypothetical protein